MAVSVARCCGASFSLLEQCAVVQGWIWAGGGGGHGGGGNRYHSAGTAHISQRGAKGGTICLVRHDSH